MDNSEDSQSRLDKMQDFVARATGADVEATPEDRKIAVGKIAGLMQFVAVSRKDSNFSSSKETVISIVRTGVHALAEVAQNDTDIHVHRMAMEKLYGTLEKDFLPYMMQDMPELQAEIVETAMTAMGNVANNDPNPDLKYSAMMKLGSIAQSWHLADAFKDNKVAYGKIMQTSLTALGDFLKGNADPNHRVDAARSLYIMTANEKGLQTFPDDATRQKYVRDGFNYLLTARDDPNNKEQKGFYQDFLDELATNQNVVNDLDEETLQKAGYLDLDCGNMHIQVQAMAMFVKNRNDAVKRRYYEMVEAKKAALGENGLYITVQQAAEMEEVEMRSTFDRTTQQIGQYKLLNKLADTIRPKNPAAA